jgi:hypothetical protein
MFACKGMHVPLLHVEHVPHEAWAQHVASTQLPLTHSPPPPHAWPFGKLVVPLDVVVEVLELPIPPWPLPVVWLELAAPPVAGAPL